jgi:hypothetical protein
VDSTVLVASSDVTIRVTEATDTSWSAATTHAKLPAECRIGTDTDLVPACTGYGHPKRGMARVLEALGRRWRL